MPCSVSSEPILLTVFLCAGPGLTVTVISHFSGWLHIPGACWRCNEPLTVFSSLPNLKQAIQIWSLNLQRAPGTCPGAGSKKPDCYLAIQRSQWHNRQFITACYLHLLTMSHTVSGSFALRSHRCLWYPLFQTSRVAHGKIKNLSKKIKNHSQLFI